MSQYVECSQCSRPSSVATCSNLKSAATQLPSSTDQTLGWDAMQVGAALLGLCNELIAGIVSQVPEFRNLKALSLAHRAFTNHCQKRLFETLCVDQTNRRLATVYDTFERNPCKTAYIRHLYVRFPWDDEATFNPSTDARFLHLMQLISDSPRPLYTFFLSNVDHLQSGSVPLVMDRILTARIPRALTSLSISNCDLPKTAISRCSELKELYNSEVRLIEPDEKLEGTPAKCNTSLRMPHLESFCYNVATETVKEILSALGSDESIVELSTLRILDLIPEHQEDMAMAQAILDAGQDSFEELRLTQTTNDPSKLCLPLKPISTCTQTRAGYTKNRYFSLANLLSFRHLSRLRVFRLRSAVYDSDPKRMKVVDDMRIMLSRLPRDNCLDTLEYRVQVFGESEYAPAVLQNWRGLAMEIIRVSAGRPFRFLFEMDARPEPSVSESEDLDDWPCYDDSMLRPGYEKLESLVDHEMRDIKAQ
ncbi:hypothetical protein BKA70DRAFT_1568615 [Coprinopsis sp. MPI-PUGE-AT-0042]|nr:hypothetical protein BKA70DRAFT_1568615 [Coprinopsis sp. MPI-PUGE-AT-0042]